MTTATFMLKGQSLLDFVADKMPLIERGELTRTDMVKDAGYVYDNGKAMYVDFYTELLNAKGVVPVMYSEADDAAYDALPKVTKELYDHVDARFGEKWDHEQVMDFIEELSDIDITNHEAFDEFFYGVYDSEREFAEEYISNTFGDLPWVVEINLDYRGIAHDLSEDYDIIEFDYQFYYFTK